MKAICAGAAIVLLAACGKSPMTDDGTGTSAAATVAELPLKRGFYVASDTACGQASNATLLLVRAGGVNGSRDSCDFKAIERTGPTSYRLTEQCADSQAGPDSAQTQTVDWEIPDEASFMSKSDAGWQRSARYCEQSSLPEPWRDNDISDLYPEKTHE